MTLDEGPSLAGAAVLVIEDGPTVTHGGMAFGAGTVAARGPVSACRSTRGRTPSARSRASSATTRTWATSCRRWATPTSSSRSSRRRSTRIDCDAVITGTPIDLGRLIDSVHPIRHVGYELEEIGTPDLEAVLQPLVQRIRATTHALTS